MKKISTAAIILKRINLGDSDRLYTLITPEYGKISAMAKGVRKITSKRAGNLDTLNLVNISVTQSTAGYYTISEVKTQESFSNIKKDYALVQIAYYIVELVHRTTEEHMEHTGVFDLLYDSLCILNAGLESPFIAQNYFELNFLKLMGYGVILNRCVNCDKPLSEEWLKIGFDYNTGGLVCENCSRVSFSISRAAIYAMNLMKLKNFSNIKNMRNYPSVEITGLLRNLLEMHVGAKLKSLDI